MVERASGRRWLRLAVWRRGSRVSAPRRRAARALPRPIRHPASAARARAAPRSAPKTTRAATRALLRFASGSVMRQEVILIRTSRDGPSVVAARDLLR